MCKVSVIIPLYNKRETVRVTIESVLKQTFQDFEIIVIDDGSTDGGAKVVEEICDERIRLYHQHNQGLPATRNNGLQYARGEWIMHLDADDILLPDAMSVLLSHASEDYDIIVGNVYNSRDGKDYATLICPTEGTVANNYRSLFLKRIWLRAGNTLISSKFNMVNRFNPDIRRYEDYWFAMNALKTARIYSTKSVVFRYMLDTTEESRPCSDLTKDYTFSLDFDSYSFWGKCFLGTMLFFAKWDYKEQTSFLRRKYGRNYLYQYIAAFVIHLQALYLRMFKISKVSKA